MSRLPLPGAAGFLLALWLTPAGARGELALQIGPQSSPDAPDAQYATPAGLPAGRQFFDLVLDEQVEPRREFLFAYDLALRLVSPPSTPAGGVRLDGLEPPRDHFVFGDPGGSTFDVILNGPDYVLSGVTSRHDVVDPAAGMKVARVFYTIDPARITPGDYRIEVDRMNTVFGDDDPNRPGNVSLDVLMNDLGLIRYTLPEPAALPLLLAGGGLALRPRKRSAGMSA